MHARRPREPGLRARDAGAVGLQHHPRHHGRFPTDGDRVLTGRPNGQGYALSGGPAFGRTFHIRGAYIVCVHCRRPPVRRGTYLNV